MLNQSDNLDKYLLSTHFINSDNAMVSALAAKICDGAQNEIDKAERLYIYVSDQIKHTFDIQAVEVSRTAIDVLKYGHGLCYAQAHLLAALLRASGIPAGICYQKLIFSEEQPKAVLHAVNTLYLSSLGKWIRVDARGNKVAVDFEGNKAGMNSRGNKKGVHAKGNKIDVDAQFSIDEEKLAFPVRAELGEIDGLYNYFETPGVIAEFLEKCVTADDLYQYLPASFCTDSAILFTSNRTDTVMQKGEGMYMWDSYGRAYLDFVGGWAVNCLGHSPEVIKKALIEQSSTLVNCSPSFYNDKMLDYSKLLTSYSCFDKVFFCSTGAEANESAIKLARKFGSKYKNSAYEIITTTNGFHGRTLATMSATGKSYWKPLFAPKVEGFIHVPFNDISAVSEAINENTCAIMLELIQGEGGVNVADKLYIQQLRELCTQNNILLIFDEVQTGFGRTGKLFAYEHYGVQPDIMTLAKGIGGGFPLSAMLCRQELDIFDAGDQGGTYCAQPLAMSVGIAVLKELVEKNICENSDAMGQYILERLHDISHTFNLNNIRGQGLLIAFDLPSEKGAQVVADCMSRGLLINSPKPCTIRLMPPLIVSKDDIDLMLDILTKSIIRIDEK